MKRCLECKYYKLVNEVAGYCTEDGGMTKLANKVCKTVEPVQDRRLRVLRLMEAQEEAEVIR